MPKKKRPDDPPAKQHERFKEAAKKIGAKDEKAFERAFGKIVPPKKPKEG